MPQLNPSPWFMILVFSWAVFLIIIPTKIMAHATSNQPTSLQAPTALTPDPWNWPWH
uniref:ATP synthase complex subunit 8 n=1 Tax=Eurypharynx pelecanoides TaxID=55117 RepID=Q76MP2_EURPE|nr:ATPase subunit 8 [Eurypharynx pelecanoides]